MNILIVGEYSAFAKHLRNGFKQLGHDVTVTMTGDGWKNIKGDNEDICYKRYPIRVFGRSIPKSYYFSIFKINSYIKKRLKEKYEGKHLDLIIVINYKFLSNSCFQTGVKLDFIKKAINGGTKLIMSVCGGDPATCYSVPHLYKEWGVKKRGAYHDVRYSFLLKNSDVIIPTAFGYFKAINDYLSYMSFDNNKIYKSIPLPITVDEDYSIKSCVGRKIIVFHGVIRPQMKGTYYIQPAMERLQKDFPDLVKCICKGGIPYDEYVEIFRDMDILVDQASGGFDGWGMNATIGAMKGKCVLVSCGNQNENNMNIPQIPFVNIERNEDSIYETLKWLITNPQEIDRIKMESREFAEKYCDSAIVAKRYLKAVNLIDTP